MRYDGDNIEIQTIIPSRYLEIGLKLAHNISQELRIYDKICISKVDDDYCENHISTVGYVGYDTSKSMIAKYPYGIEVVKLLESLNELSIDIEKNYLDILYIYLRLSSMDGRKILSVGDLYHDTIDKLIAIANSSDNWTVRSVIHYGTHQLDRAELL